MRNGWAGVPRVVALVAVVVVALGACDATAPTSSLAPSGTPSVFADRPSVQIDGTWTALNGRWTFTGSVDPEGSPTDVVLDVGPGPSTLRQFDSHVPVAQALLAAGPLTITTQAIPGIPVICVRFTATNQAGASFTNPLCFLHDLPTAGPAGAPLVRIDGAPALANGQWSFTAYVDPKNAATDVIMEIGTGPATFTKQVSVAKGMLVAASLQVASADIPASGEACVRFTATNKVGTTSSAPLCFSPVSPSPSAP